MQGFVLEAGQARADLASAVGPGVLLRVYLSAIEPKGAGCL